MMGYACEPAAIQEVTCTTSSPKHDVSHSDATNDDPKRSEADQLMECDQQQQRAHHLCLQFSHQESQA